MSIKLRNNIPLFEIDNPKFASSNLTVQDTRHVRDACAHCTDAFDSPSYAIFTLDYYLSHSLSAHTIQARKHAHPLIDFSSCSVIHLQNTLNFPSQDCFIVFLTSCRTQDRLNPS